MLSFLLFNNNFFLLTFMAFGLPGYASGLYRGICWLLHTIQICQPSVWLGCFSKQLGTCISQLSAAECQLFPLASMQPLHRLSRCPECSRCFYKPPWVQCTVVALSVGGGVSMIIHLSPSLMEAQGFFSFRLNFWHTHVCLWAGFCHVHTRFKYKTHQDWILFYFCC